MTLGASSAVSYVPSTPELRLTTPPRTSPWQAVQEEPSKPVAWVWQEVQGLSPPVGCPLSSGGRPSLKLTIGVGEIAVWHFWQTPWRVDVSAKLPVTLPLSIPSRRMYLTLSGE